MLITFLFLKRNKSSKYKLSTNSTFIPPNQLKVAVLFLVFNRLDTTKKVFGAIKKAKPPRLYVAADGPRERRNGENEKVREVRDYIINNIDWECELKTLFREKNLGCKYAVSSALDWFFEIEEMGIILEDDCLPSQSFFWFCEQMLIEHKTNQQIAMITGTNYLTKKTSLLNGDYFYSNYFAVWGWATWRRAWEDYDVEMKNYISLNYRDIKYKASSYRIYLYCKTNFDLIRDKKNDTWDTQWFFHSFMNSRLCIVPIKNLITNIGVEGSHASGKITENHFIENYEIVINKSLKPVTEMFYANSDYDLGLYKRIGYKPILLNLITEFLKKLKLLDFIKKINNVIKSKFQFLFL